MVVFKKPSKAVPTLSSQTSQSLNRVESSSNTTATSEQHNSTIKTSPAPMRYSDITAGRDARNGTPIEKLMYIPELCDEVLDYLSMEELLHATRVCHAFKTNIENSSLLQAKLFLAPDLTMKRLAVSATGTLLSGAKAEHHIAATEATEATEGGEIGLYIPHPQLQSAYVSNRYKSMGMVKYASICVKTCHDQNDALLSFRDFRAVFALPETSSLHRMLLCQPPVQQVFISLHFSRTGRRSTLERPFTVRNEIGVTVGDVVNALRYAPGLKDGFDLDCPIFSMRFKRGILVNSRARTVAQRSAELSSEDDPTRLVFGGSVTSPEHQIPIWKPAVAGGFNFTPLK